MKTPSTTEFSLFPKSDFVFPTSEAFTLKISLNRIYQVGMQCNAVQSYLLYQNLDNIIPCKLYFMEEKSKRMIKSK